MIDKEEMINRIVKIISNEDVEIRSVVFSNDSKEIPDDGEWVNRALTGHQEINIELLNKKRTLNILRK